MIFMAHEKAYDARQHKCEEDACSIVYSWFKKHNCKIDKNSIYVCWFAYLPFGYKCMVSSFENDNLFFEITKNIISDEVRCACFKCFEYFVELGQKDVIDIKGDNIDTII